MSAMPIKVALTDDHLMLLDGIRNALSEEPDIEITGAYQSAQELFSEIYKSPPDILLLDLQLPDKTGQEIVAELARALPSVRIIILSGIESPLMIQEMMKEGCRGYLLKTAASKKQIVSAIRTVYKGQLFLEPLIQERLLRDVLETKRAPRIGNRKLTARERDVLQLIAMEYNNQEIADKLYISLRTVENHRHNLIQKLEVKNAIGLVKAAMELGLV